MDQGQIFPLTRRRPDGIRPGSNGYVYIRPRRTVMTPDPSRTPTPLHTPGPIPVGTAPGNEPRVQVYDAATGALKYNFLAFDSSFRGGVHVAVGDLNGDGVDDIICAEGPGGVPM